MRTPSSRRTSRQRSKEQPAQEIRGSDDSDGAAPIEAPTPELVPEPEPASAPAPAPPQDPRKLILDIYDSGVAAAAPGPVTARAVDALRIDRDRRVWIYAVGKAAHAMAGAAAASLLRSLHSIVGGVVVSPEGGASPYPTLLSLRGDHPIPGPNSFAAAAKIEEVTAGRRGTDVAIVLISGGASSLIGAPLRGMNGADV